MNEDYVKQLIKKEKLDALEKVDVSINKRIQHLKPSPETINLVKKVEIQIELMKKDIKTLCENQSKMEDKLDSIIEKLDNKYAAKWSENMWKATGLGAIIIVVSYILIRIGLPTP